MTRSDSCARGRLREIAAAELRVVQGERGISSHECALNVLTGKLMRAGVDGSVCMHIRLGHAYELAGLPSYRAMRPGEPVKELRKVGLSLTVISGIFRLSPLGDDLDFSQLPHMIAAADHQIRRERRTGDPMADRILVHLHDVGEASRRAIRDLFCHHMPRARIERAREQFLDRGWACVTKVPTRGRYAEVWKLT